MKRLFEDTINATVGWIASLAAIAFTAGFTANWFSEYYLAKRQWESNWRDLFNPTFESYPFIQDMNALGIDLYAHAEKLKPSVWSSEFALSNLLHVVSTTLVIVTMYAVYYAAVEWMTRRNTAKISI